MSAYRLADSKPARLGHGSLVLGLAGQLLALLLTEGLRQLAARQLLGLHAQAAEQLAHTLRIGNLVRQKNLWASLVGDNYLGRRVASRRNVTRRLSSC